MRSIHWVLLGLSVALWVAVIGSIVACLNDERFLPIFASAIFAAFLVTFIFISEYGERRKPSFVYFEATSFNEAIKILRRVVYINDATELRVRRAFNLQIGDLLGFSISKGFLKIEFIEIDKDGNKCVLGYATSDGFKPYMTYPQENENALSH